MRLLRILIVLLSLIVCDFAYSQTILKIHKRLVLIDTDQNSGLVIGDEVAVLRRFDSGKIKHIGKVKIIKFAKGKCAGKIIAEDSKYQISIGDLVEMPNSLNENYYIDEDAQSLSSGPSDVGIDKGDSEIRFLGFYAKIVGSDNVSLEMGAIQLSYGYFVTSHLQIGFAPQLMIYQGYGGGTYTIFSAAAFFNYNLTTSSKIIPYLSGQWYQDEFDPEDDDFLEHSYLTVGIGVRNFVTEFAALNTSVTYGFSLAEEAEGGLLMIMSGLSFIF